MKKLLFLAFLLQSIVLKAQYMVTAEGDSIDLKQEILSGEEETLFIQGNGLLLNDKLTPDKLLSLEDTLYTTRKMLYADYLTLAMIFDGYDDKWPLAYRCAATANMHANVINAFCNDSVIVDAIKENTLTAYNIERNYFLAHIEDDYDVIYAQLDSVVASFNRMDDYDKIYGITDVDFDGAAFSNSLATEVAKILNRFKRHNYNTPKQMKAIRLFLKVCNANRKNKTTLAKTAQSTISRSLSYDLSKKVDIVLTPDYWEGWSADDKTYTLLEKVDDHIFKVILQPNALNTSTSQENPVTSMTFFLRVSLPTDSNTWRVDDIIPGEEP